MTICRSASCTRSARGIAGRLPSRDPAEGRSNGQTKSGQIAASKNVAGHDLAGREDVLRWSIVVHDHLGLLVDGDAEVGEGDPRPKWIATVRWRIDWPGPVTLRDFEPF